MNNKKHLVIVMCLILTIICGDIFARNAPPEKTLIGSVVKVDVVKKILTLKIQDQTGNNQIVGDGGWLDLKAGKTFLRIDLSKSSFQEVGGIGVWKKFQALVGKKDIIRLNLNNQAIVSRNQTTRGSEWKLEDGIRIQGKVEIAWSNK